MNVADCPKCMDVASVRLVRKTKKYGVLWCKNCGHVWNVDILELEGCGVTKLYRHDYKERLLKKIAAGGMLNSCELTAKKMLEYKKWIQTSKKRKRNKCDI